MSKSKELDQRYQDCVDSLARKTLNLSREELLNYEDYGSIVHDGGLEVAFWHFTLPDETHHIVFLTDRRLTKFFPVYRKFIAGVFLGSHEEPRLMTAEEYGEYA